MLKATDKPMFNTLSKMLDYMGKEVTKGTTLLTLRIPTNEVGDDLRLWCEANGVRVLEEHFEAA